jgi:hypothetical protein
VKIVAFQAGTVAVQVADVLGEEVSVVADGLRPWQT